MKVIGARTLDIRNKKPDLFGRAIMWWCFTKAKTPKSQRFHHTADVFTIQLDDGRIIEKVYDANIHYEENNYTEWIKDWDIINTCDTIKAFDISEEQIQKIWERAKSFVGTGYGVYSILGILWHGITKGVTIGVDGTKSLICSESSIRLYEFFLEGIIYPIDYLDPYERGFYFPMEPYTEV